jgi:hypothetical protein
MPAAPRSYGRAAIIGVVVSLVLLICAGVYAFLAQSANSATELGLFDPAAEQHYLKRKILLLTILLVSALLILLFVIGCYFVLRIGGLVRRPVAGAPTPYVDAWRGYRITDEQIAAATAEPPENPGDAARPGSGPPPPPRKPPDRPDVKD